MCTHTRTRAVAERARREIASSKSLRGRRVDRERRQVAQVAPRATSPRARRRRLARLALDERAKRRRRPRSSISASSTSRATSGRPSRAQRPSPWPAARAVRRDQHEVAGAARGPARPVDVTRRPRSKNGSAVRKRPRFSSTRRRPAARGPPARLDAPRAAPRARRRLTRPRADRADRDVERLVALASSGRPSRPTSGSMPAPCLTPPPPRLRPLGREVLADGDVERAAVGAARSISWKTPLPNVRVPDELRAVAVLQRARDDLRRRGAVAVDEHDDRDLRRDRVAGRLERRARAARARAS